MCDRLSWHHPLWRAVARRAHVRLALVLAVRNALAEDPQARHPAVLAEGLATTEAPIARVLEAMEQLGVLRDGKLVAILPEPETPELVEAMVKPGTLRQRRRRARLRALNLSTGNAVTLPGTAVTPNAVHLAEGNTDPRPAAAPAQRPAAEIVPRLSVAPAIAAGDAARRYSGNAPRNEEPLDDLKKKLARREESEISGGGYPDIAWTAPQAEKYLDRNRRRARQWLLTTTHAAMTRLPAQQYAQMLEELTNEAAWNFLLYKQRRPAWVFRHLDAIDDQLKGRAPPNQRPLLLPIAGSKPETAAENDERPVISLTIGGYFPEQFQKAN